MARIYGTKVTGITQIAVGFTTLFVVKRKLTETY